MIQQKAFIRSESDKEEQSPIRIGHILEIKKKNRHVYVRVYWMYKPEDIAITKQDNYGKREVIATNHMAVIHASNLINPIPGEVYLFDEASNSPKPPAQHIYWRQHYNILTKELTVSP